jgi:2-polyprenyl-6-methoxyphenol hydroxylase-like FAD-dependent oxidoreductase
LITECLRDFELDDELRKLASPKEAMAHTRGGYSMVGEEFARAYSWGNGPLAEARYKLASPCEPMDLPQTKLEPVLIRKATSTNFRARFNTEFLYYEEDVEPGFIDVLVKDLMFNHVYRIRTRYLFGADGARSKIIKQLGLPLRQRSGGGLAWNVLVKVDLSKNIEYRNGNLHWCYQHDLEHPDFAWIGFPRMVKPWNEWVFIMFPVQGYEPNPPPTHEQWSKRIQQMIGDDTIPFEILNISKWNVNDIVAEKYSRGRIFCLGDAVHRHPPANGLGSNTCIQDAYNLAWKVAYVIKGTSPHIDFLPLKLTLIRPCWRGIVELIRSGTTARWSHYRR